MLLWWTGLLQIRPIQPEEWAGVVDGVNYGRILGQMFAAAYWPVILFAVCRIGFDLMRVALGGNARLTAAGDILFGLAAAWGVLWIWFWSPLSPAIWVGTATEFFERIRILFDRSGGQETSLATILMVVVVWAFAVEVARIVRAGARLAVGGDAKAA